MSMRPTGPLIWLGCAVLLVISACLVVLADFSVADEVFGIDSTEDVFSIVAALVFSAVAIWGIAAIFGLLRLRRWGRSSALWIGRALFLVYLPEIARYAYIVKTAPDVGWSWQALYPLTLFLGAGALVLFLFSRLQVRDQFLGAANRATDAEQPTTD